MLHVLFEPSYQLHPLPIDMSLTCPSIFWVVQSVPGPGELVVLGEYLQTQCGSVLILVTPLYFYMHDLGGIVHLVIEA